ncbi:fatty-acid amide hydrolase 2-like [Ostrinia furnacalis]|uniref:fatty-acid amide hydrolase 2-like n=1 Tax=Ostrinia furnacalis TaxID=93504 RepID=UPI00103E8810|nr:fatty-acid amide hydrolase 2-like [Ostrinia furnacalis]
MCRVIVVIIQFFRGIVDHVLEFIFGLYWDRQREPVPDLGRDHACLTESAVSLARRIKNGELKSEDLVRAAIERINQVNPILNAVVGERYEDALAEAREVDQRIAMGITDDFFEKPFLGVPFTTKESSAIKGLPLTYGLWSRRNQHASQDCEAVIRMRAAGAIPLAVTNLPELLIWNETRNPVYGTTNNPHHTGRSPGGSSGAEAALMASYATPISLSSDVAGSTRIPAFNCGLFGYHPTGESTNLRGLFDRTGYEPTMFCLGFISKHVEDLAPLTRIVAGDKQKILNLDRQTNLKDVKIFYTESFGDWWMSPIRSDLRNSMNDVILNMEKKWPTQNSPKPFYHEGFNYATKLWQYWMEKEPEDYFSLYNNGNGKPFILFELIKKITGFSRHTLNLIIRLATLRFLPSVNSEWAEKLTRDLKKHVCDTLGDNGVLLLPSGPIPCPYHYIPYTGPYNFGYWAIVNVLKCPAVQVPLGTNSKGLPLGIQVMAAPGNDALCLAVAKYLEQEYGGAIMACKAKGRL